jgi:hypothetical protein
MAKFVVPLADLEHIRLHIWELQQMLERMLTEHNPEAPRLASILERFINVHTQDDRP